jgi:hypothetical protein
MPAKKTSPKKPASKSKTANKPTQAVRVRMYRVGLGDCFLLTFPNDPKPVHMLVDCGVFFQTPNEKQHLRNIVADIKTATGGTIDVLVGTHEHYDHFIGFRHARDVFETMTIKQVWLSWIEKPGEPGAAWLRTIENKLKRGLQIALRQAMASPSFKKDAPGLANVLQFGGDPLAADYSEQLGDVKRWLRDDLTTTVEYLKPHGAARDLAPGVRVYTLGPPIKQSWFRKMNDSKHQRETYHTDFALAAVPAFSSSDFMADRNAQGGERSARELAMPFDARWQIRASDAPTWKTPVVPERPANSEAFFAERYGFNVKDEHAWRRIDNNWLAEAENLAMQLDSLTNNSSLALAIEVGSSKRVILLAADAQVGNWLSWHDSTWTCPDSGSTAQVKAEDLLGRTVLYKVGHHGSHNATLKQKGLELMTSDELVAMIPVDQDFANNKKHWQMPYPGLLTELTKRTKGRIIRADHGLPKKSDVDVGVRAKFFAAASETPLYSEYLVPM